MSYSGNVLSALFLVIACVQMVLPWRALDTWRKARCQDLTGFNLSVYSWKTTAFTIFKTHVTHTSCQNILWWCLVNNLIHCCQSTNKDLKEVSVIHTRKGCKRSVGCYNLTKDKQSMQQYKCFKNDTTSDTVKNTLYCTHKHATWSLWMNLITNLICNSI